MSSEFPKVPLGHLTINYDSKRRPVKSSDRKSGPYPYYGASGIVDYVDGYIFDGEYLLVGEDGENMRTRQTPIAFLAKGKFWVNNHAHIVRGNGNASTKYLKYALAVTDISAYLTGAVMPKLTQGNLNKIPIPCPAVEVQDGIVRLLGSLDDSIDTLQHQNTTLEAIAQRLFRSWFVNFDPVHAKAAGREPEAMSAETAALFPSEFEESALGLIPKGWDITTLGVVADFIKGRSYKSEELKPSPVALVTLKSFQRGGGFRLDGFKPYVGKYKDDQVVIPGECIVALTDVTQNAEVIGRPAMVYPSDFKNVASLDVGILRPKNKAVTKEFLYCLLREQRYVGHILGHTTGTTVLHLSKDGVPSYQFAIPPSGVVRRFCDIASPLFKTIEANVLVANRLTQLRDHLLPRLISGKLSLADAEAALAAVKPEVELAQGHSPA